MGICRVVSPETVRLPLSHGDYIDVQKELNAGDYFDYILAMAERKPFAKLLAYLIGWSLVGLENAPVPYSLDLPETARRDTIRSLNTPTVKELAAVIDRHEAAIDAARTEKKTTPLVEGAS